MSSKRVESWSPYPRSKLFKVWRTFLRLWWLLFIIYPSNVIFNISSLLANDGVKGLENTQKLRQGLLVNQIISLWNSRQWVLVTAGAVVVVLTALGRWAVLDKKREDSAISARAAADDRSAKDRELLSSATEAAQTLAQTETVTILRNINLALSRNVAENLKGSSSQAEGEEWMPPQDDTLLPTPEFFVGREADVTWVVNHLRDADGIVAIRGMAGIGKTSLAAVGVKQCRDAGLFPDGIAAVFCHGTGDPFEVLQKVVSGFDRRGGRSADSLEDLLRVGRHILAGRSALAVLDNVEPTLPVGIVITNLQGMGLKILVTSRHVLPPGTLPSSNILELDLLSPGDALELFLRTFAPTNSSGITARERLAAERIVVALDRHTLAVRLAAAYAADTRRDLRVLAGELERDPLSVPEGDAPRAVARMFMESITLASEEARSMFSALGAFATPTLGRKAALAAGSALGVIAPPDGLDQLILRTLVDSFVDRGAPDTADRERIRLHPLIQKLARERLGELTGEQRASVFYGVASHYAQYVTENQESYSALRRDEENIYGALDWCLSASNGELLVAICLGLIPYWLDRWRTSVSYRYLRYAVQVAETNSQDGSGLAENAMNDLRLAYAQVLWRRGAVDEAESALTTNLVVRQRLGDAPGECIVRQSLGALAWRSGRLEEAEAHLGQGILIAQRLDNKKTEADLLMLLGRIARDRGKLDIGRVRLQQSLLLAEQIDDVAVQGRILEELGIIAQDSGDLHESEELLRKSLAIAEANENEREIASITARMAHIANLQKDGTRAEQLYRRSLGMFESLGDRLACGWARRRLGEVLCAAGNFAEANTCLNSALDIARESKDRRNEGFALAALAEFHQKTGDLTSAVAFYSQALECAQAVGNRRGEALVIFGLANVAQLDGHRDDAGRHYKEALRIFDEVHDALSGADVCVAYGQFLIVQVGDSIRGCDYLRKALSLREEFSVPSARQARELLANLGCGVALPETQDGT